MQGQENSRKSAGGLTATALKWAALAAMTLDHAAWMFLPAEEYPAASFFLHLIGRAAFPVFAFLAAQGAEHTSCLLRYAGRLLLFGLVSVAPAYFAFGDGLRNNVLFTLLLGVLALSAVKRCPNRRAGVFTAAVLVLAGFWFDWGMFGVLSVVLFGLCREKRQLLFPLAVLAAGNYFLLNAGPIYSLCALGVLLALPLLRAYGGEKGRAPKFVFYVYYPSHLFLLWLISVYLPAAGNAS